MAIGLGRMFGFEFCINFNYPYTADSVRDFWRRWHISLSTWFRDYLYFPLGGNRVKAWKYIRNVFLVWFCTGFWHGAGWNFIIWGLYFGFLRVLEKQFLAKYLEKLPRFLRHVYLLVIVLISWVFFAIEDIGDIGRYLATMFGFGGVPFADDRFIYLLYTNAVILVVLTVASLPVIPYIKQKFMPKYEKAISIAVIPICIAIWFLATASLVSGSFNPCLYFRF